MPIEVEGELEFEVERILMHRERKTNRVTKKEYLIKWFGYGPEHCTWEPENALKHAQESLDDYWKQQEAIQNAALQKRDSKLSKQLSSKRPLCAPISASGSASKRLKK
jgi:hypothetical protein